MQNCPKKITLCSNNNWAYNQILRKGVYLEGENSCGGRAVHLAASQQTASLWYEMNWELAPYASMPPSSWWNISSVMTSQSKYAITYKLLLGEMRYSKGFNTNDSKDIWCNFSSIYLHKRMTNELQAGFLLLFAFQIGSVWCPPYSLPHSQ